MAICADALPETAGFTRAVCSLLLPAAVPFVVAAGADALPVAAVVFALAAATLGCLTGEEVVFEPLSKPKCCSQPHVVAPNISPAATSRVARRFFELSIPLFAPRAGELTALFYSRQRFEGTFSIFFNGDTVGRNLHNLDAVKLLTGCQANRFRPVVFLAHIRWKCDDSLIVYDS